MRTYVPTLSVSDVLSLKCQRCLDPVPRGQTNVSKVHLLKCAAYNLGLLLRKVWGLSKPRSAAAWLFVLFALGTLMAVWVAQISNSVEAWLWSGCSYLLVTMVAYPITCFIRSLRKNRHFLTGC